MRSIKNKKEEINLFELGLGGIVAGTLGMMYSPEIALIMFGMGGVSCIMHFLDNNRDLKKLWENTNLYKENEYPLIKDKIITNYGYKLRLTLPIGLSTKDFENKLDAISQYLGYRCEVDYERKTLILKVYEKKLKAEYKFQPLETKGPTELITGMSYDNKLETVNLSEGSPHILIAGETGSGKSTLLRGIITNIILTKKPKDLELHLIDLKNGAEFGLFKNCEIVKSFSRTKEEAETQLSKINIEIDRRYNIFYEADCVDIKEFNNKHRANRIKHMLIIVDEFADLQNEKGSISIIETLAAKARACGIHLVISTQRPDSKILNGRIKANVPVIVGLKTMNDINSRIIIDDGGLEELKGKGHGILKHNGKELEIQAMNITPTQAKKALKPFIQAKKNENLEKNENTGEVKDFTFLRALKGGKS